MAEDIRTFLGRFDKVKRIGQNQYQCCCPAHNDKSPSMSIKDDTSTSGRILLHCQAGCRTEDILAAIGLGWDAIQPESENKVIPKRQSIYRDGIEYELTAEYQYRDSCGRYLYCKRRYENRDLKEKTFIIGRVIDDEFIYGRGEAKPTLFNLQGLRKAIEAGKTIYYVEGEKDVETLRKYGLFAVSAGAVGDWKSEFADYFIGASKVIIIADRDDAGQNLARQISEDIRPVVYEHKVITPSGLHKGDVTDYLTEEHQTIDDLYSIVKDAVSVYATWVSSGNSKSSINPDLLAAEYMKRNSVFVARNPGTKSDLIFLYKNGVYHKLSDTELSGEIRRWIPVGKARPDTITQVTKMILFSADVKEYEEMDADEHYINLRNGLLDIFSGELKPHDPELISTLQLSSSYDPTEKNPRMWESFIESLCYDPETDEIDREMISVVQEWTGLILSPIYGYRVKKCLLLFSALGNSGKTVYLSVIGSILGNDATANVDFQSLGSSRWATGRAFGKRLLAIGDEGGESIDSSKIFKQLTGGDKVSAEFKGLQGFDYRFRGVICAACNLLPFFNDDKGDHVAERLMLLNCRHTIPMQERDPLLIDKLLAEKDGIFVWAMEGLQRFIEQGMKFSPCKSSDDLMIEYRARHDTMYAFLVDRIEITGDRTDYIRKTEFENMYKVYCECNDVQPLKSRNIKPRLASLGITTKNHSRAEVFTGIKLKEP